MNLKEQIESSVNYIRSITDFQPEIGMILGSGLGGYADQIEIPCTFPMERFRASRYLR